MLDLMSIVGSKTRFAVLLTVGKAWRTGVPVAPATVARVFGVNTPGTYRLFKMLEREGFLRRADRGYVATERASKLADFVLELAPRAGDAFDWLRLGVPETMYYVAEPRLKTWFGPTNPLIVIDRRLRGLVSPPRSARLIYASLRGRAFKYSWDRRLAVASPEQSYADLLSHDESWASYLPDVLSNPDMIDEVFARAGGEGRRRLASSLVFYEVLTGRRVPRSFDAYLHLEGKALEAAVSMTPYLVDGTVLERGML